MFDYLKNPASKIRFPQRYTWVKEVETMGPYKLRIVTNGIFARRPADHLLLASAAGIRRIDRGR